MEWPVFQLGLFQFLALLFQCLDQTPGQVAWCFHSTNLHDQCPCCADIALMNRPHVISFIWLWTGHLTLMKWGVSFYVNLHDCLRHLASSNCLQLLSSPVNNAIAGEHGKHISQTMYKLNFVILSPELCCSNTLCSCQPLMRACRWGKGTSAFRKYINSTGYRNVQCPIRPSYKAFLWRTTTDRYRVPEYSLIQC